jgi:hypothetical protein
MTNWIKKNYFFFVLIAIYALCIFFIKPFKDFPLNDDWAYAWSSEQLVKHGVLKISDWVSPTSVFHVVLGALFSFIFGFNHGTLRLTTLFMSLLGGFFLYKLIRQTGKDEYSSIFGALLLIFNPLYFVFSFTFHTDITFFSVSIISIYSYYQASGNREKTFWTASIFSAFAFLTRQIGIAIPISMATLLFIRRELTVKKFMEICLIPLVSLIWYLWWFNTIHGSNWANQNYVVSYTIKYIINILPFIKSSIFRIMGSLMYMGSFLIPAGIALIFLKKEKFSLNKTIILYLFVVAVALFLLLNGFLPYFENALHRKGLGIITVSGGSTLKPAGLLGSISLWGTITILALITATLILRSSISQKSVKQMAENRFGIITLPWILMYLMSFIGSRYFDRYPLVLLPPLISIALLQLNNKILKKPTVSVFIGAMIAFSLLGTMDYFAWNTAKWELGQKAEDFNIKKSEVANGFDWDATWLYEKNMNFLKSKKKVTEIGEWEWQTINRYKAIVSYSPKYSKPEMLLERQFYKTPLSKGPATLYLWKLED